MGMGLVAGGWVGTGQDLGVAHGAEGAWRGVLLLEVLASRRNHIAQDVVPQGTEGQGKFGAGAVHSEPGRMGCEPGTRSLASVEGAVRPAIGARIVVPDLTCRTSRHSDVPPLSVAVGFGVRG